MKSRFLPLILSAAVLASIPLWNTGASAQSASETADSSPKPPIGKSVTITLDARSNSRSELSQDIRRYSGFTHHNTVEGTMLHMDSEWLVLKDGIAENWIPRDKVLMIHARN